MPEPEHNSAEELGHEPLAIRARAVSIAAAVLFGGIVAALLLMAGLSIYLAAVWRGPPQVGVAEPSVEPPPGVPLIDANQQRTLQALRVREKSLLSEYAWIDRDEGIARIPIGRAMEILSAQGEPAAKTPTE
jgi:hypothetical protein